jgi:WD40 repeat protein
MNSPADQQVGSESSPSREGRLDAFVSYSHQDAQFVVDFKKALERVGRNVWVDADDIPPGAPWRRELGSGIEAADAFIFVISPNSLASAECRKELDRAVELGKRIVPLLLRDVTDIPRELADWQFIDTRNESDLKRSIQLLEQALDSDPEWVRAHTQWLARALRWDEHGREKGYLLRRGGDLQAAEQWLAQQVGKKPSPTTLQTEYIARSREYEKRRLQTLLAAALAAVGVAVGLAILAFLQRNEAIAQRDQAYSRELAASAVSQLTVDPELSILLALEAGRVEPTPETQDALRRSLRESYVRQALRGHEGSVSSVTFNKTGSILATAARDGTIRLWNTRNGEITGILRGHEGPVQSAEFGPGDEFLVTASEDGTARVWRLQSREEIAVFARHRGPISTAVLSRDGDRVVTAGTDGTARVFNVEGAGETAVLRGHKGAVESAVFSPDGNTVMTAGTDATVRLWDLRTADDVVLGKHEQPVFSAAFDARGKRALTLAADVTKVWDVASGDLVATLGQAFEARFSPNGNQVLTATNDGVAKIWQAGTGAEIATLRESHGGPVLDAEWSRDASLVVTAGLDQTAKVWDPATGDVVAVLRGHTKTVNAAAFDRTGRAIATGSSDLTARVWDIPVTTVLEGHGPLDIPIKKRTSNVVSADFSPDGELLLTAASDGLPRVWDLRSGRQVMAPPGCEPVSPAFSCLSAAVLGGHLSPLTDAEFGPDGTTVLTAGEDGTAQVWEAASGRNIARLEGHEGPIWSASFSPGGERVVTAGEDATARIWSVATGEELVVLKGHERAVTSADFEPDGRTVVTSGLDETLRLWNASNGTQRRILARGAGGVGGISISSDGRLVAAPAGQETRIIEMDTGANIALLRGHSGLVTSASFSPEGKTIITASLDRTARIWEIARGTEVDTLRGHAGGLNAALFSPDGSHIATAAQDGTARVYICETCKPFTALVDQARRGLTRQLTPGERRRFLN